MNSSDESKRSCHEKDLPSLVLPAPCHTIGSGEVVLSFDDCTDDVLKNLFIHFNVEHLSECTDSNLLKYPIAGLVHGTGNRFVAPLKVQKDLSSKPLVVFFVVDSGAPWTSFSAKTSERLFGSDDFDSALVQGVSVPCRSSGGFSEPLKDVNLLGSQFLLKENISIILSPHTLDFPYTDERVFYLAPSSLVNHTQLLSASSQQCVDVTKRFEVRPINKLSRSDPTATQDKMVEKTVYSPLEKLDESLTSASTSDQQKPPRQDSSMEIS